MGLKVRRKIFRTGNSSVLSIPAIEKGQFATVAANRIMLVDPRGEISEGKLLEFLENCVEPLFWKWLQEDGGLKKVTTTRRRKVKEGG